MATVSDRPERTSETAGRDAVARAASAASGARTRRTIPLLGVPYGLAPLTAILAGLFALAAIVLAIVLSVLPGPVPPATGAATLVPADALLYLHISTDPSRPEVRQALSRVDRMPAAPLLFSDVTDRLDALLSDSQSTVDFATDVEPWLGREAAFAVLDTPGSRAGTLVVLDVRNRARARAFLAQTGATSDGSYRGVALLRQTSGTTMAFVGHYLVLGQAQSVDAAIDVAAGRARSLANDATYGRAASTEPADRVLDFYAPAAGVTRALLPNQGLLGALGVLLDQPALRAVAVSASPDSGGIAVRVNSMRDPKLIPAGGQARQFVPSLADVLPSGSTMLLDAGNFRRAFSKLLAAAAKVGVAGRAATLLGRLGAALTAQGVNLGRLFSIFGSETAFAVVPGRAGMGPAPVVIGRTADPAAARDELASIEEPLTQAFAPPSGASGIVPEVNDTTVPGATVSQVTLAPGLQFDWAVSHGLVVLSTSADAITGVFYHRTSLAGEARYRAATANASSPTTSLVFFDLSPLLRLGEQTGLIGSTALAALRPNLDGIRAIGLASTGGGSDTTTELQLQIR